MKRIFKQLSLTLVLSAATFMMACEEELVTFEGPYHARFTGTSATVTEGSGTESAISVHYAGPEPSEAINIEFSISGGTVGEDFELAGGSTTVTIPAGEFFGSFTVSPIDNFETDGNKSIVFEITSVSGGIDAGLGLVGKKFTYNITDDDCDFEVSNFTGTYDCDEPGYAVYEVALAAGEDPNTVVVSNFWDYAVASIYIVFDPNSNELEVPDQPIGLTSGGSPLHAVGSGTYTACDGNFKYDYTVYRLSDGAVFDENTHTYTK